MKPSLDSVSTRDGERAEARLCRRALSRTRRGRPVISSKRGRPGRGRGTSISCAAWTGLKPHDSTRASQLGAGKAVKVDGRGIPTGGQLNAARRGGARWIAFRGPRGQAWHPWTWAGNSSSASSRFSSRSTLSAWRRYSSRSGGTSRSTSASGSRTRRHGPGGSWPSSSCSSGGASSSRSASARGTSRSPAASSSSSWRPAS